MTKRRGFRSILDRLEKLDARRKKHFKTEEYQNNHHHIFLKKLIKFCVTTVCVHLKAKCNNSKCNIDVIILHFATRSHCEIQLMSRDMAMQLRISNQQRT